MEAIVECYSKKRVTKFLEYLRSSGWTLHGDPVPDDYIEAMGRRHVAGSKICFRLDEDRKYIRGWDYHQYYTKEEWDIIGIREFIRKHEWKYLIPDLIYELNRTACLR